MVVIAFAPVSDTASRSPLFPAPYHKNSGVTLPEDAKEPGCPLLAAGLRGRTEWCGVVHAVTLRQNLHQFQAGENVWNAASVQVVHTGLDYRMTHWKLERSMKSKLINCH